MELETVFDGMTFSKGPLMAVDALGRKTPDLSDGLPTSRENRLVGLFYFLWLGECGKHKPYNVSEIMAKDPAAGYKPNDPIWGGYGCYHHWGEPFYGYYYSNDEWVVRHHMKLIMQAGIDFLFFDTTNAVIYEQNAKLVMRVLQEYHDKGWHIPRVMFYTNTASGRTVQQIYEAVYLPNYCPDTWFCLDGKPVIIAVESECSPECRAFFNIKMSQWPNEPDKLGGWPWMDFTRPQRVFANLKGEPEVINVSVAQHPQLRFGDSVMYGENGNCGRAYHNGRNDPDPDAWKRGYNFSEQFDRAVQTDPPIVLVTGWNEWIAGYWRGVPERPVMFVDCANYEYSRDIEMMRGGYFDNYFMQLVSYVRRYKGIEESPKIKQVGNAAETVNTDLSDGTVAVYRGFCDGDFPRHAEGSGTVYVNETQRNAIESVRVTHDADTLCFSVEASKLNRETDTDGTWMNIYVNTDCESEGYTYVLKPLTGIDADGSVQIIRVTGKHGDLTGYTVNGALGTWIIRDGRMVFTVKKSDLGISGGDVRLWFKVADSKKEITNISDFYEYGDAAPLGRLNYVFYGD